MNKGSSNIRQGVLDFLPLQLLCHSLLGASTAANLIQVTDTPLQTPPGDNFSTPGPSHAASFGTDPSAPHAQHTLSITTANQPVLVGPAVHCQHKLHDRTQQHFTGSTK